VRLVKTFLALLMVLAWVPLSVHCQIERVLDVSLLSCVSSTPASNTDSHCGDDACCAWESGDYFPPTRECPLVHLLPAPVLLDRPLEFAPGNVRQFEKVLPATPPPDLPTSWQFSHRTALPPRAPSLAS
jgi:hypothetical protein